MASQPQHPSPEVPLDDNTPNSAGLDPSAPPPLSTAHSSTPTMTSEDSDTVLLKSPSIQNPIQDSIPTPVPSRPSAPSRTSTTGVKRCWICICDSTEDDPLDPPVWRSPCSCTLTAHEKCLLDWVADIENPKNRKRQPPPAQILCPQCKTEIKISRPKSYVVRGVHAVDRVIGSLVLPGLGLSLLGTFWAGAFIHGFQAVYVVFGREDAGRIFQRALQNRSLLQGYPLIPLNLIFAQTSYADFMLPSGTLFLLGVQLSERFEIDMTIWPPRPSTVFACLPALRSAYNWCFMKAFGSRLRQWMAEVQPRQEEPAEGDEPNEANIVEAAEEALEEALEEAGVENQRGDILFEVDINIGGGDAIELPAAGGDAAAEAPENANVDGVHEINQILGGRGDEILGGADYGQRILGSLLFPAISAGMGGLLSYAIPRDWMTNANFANGRPGFLRSRWGRSVLGGCIFIVLKDAVELYCRWKLAQTHRQRKILDFDKKAKKYRLS